MNKIVKYLSGKTVQPVLVRYLSKQRAYTYNDICLQIPPQVFHPAFFFSTKRLLQFIDGLNIARKTFLELGAGSGLIAMSAAKKGALVTATDINTMAVEFLKRNQKSNNIAIQVIASDLFNDIPKQVFDVIAINPPFYKKNPATEAEHAWYCGENSEYFTRLFQDIGGYINSQSEVYMTLCDECDIDLIQSIALQHGYQFKLVSEKRKLWETNYIFKIETGVLQNA